ncbi:MAG TPA: M36 family metallopeptidase [Blastocatellia bacterium]|nr:M36 family metallopeptidase [Blastocatellia bacterium]
MLKPESRPRTAILVSVFIVAFALQLPIHGSRSEATGETPALEPLPNFDIRQMRSRRAPAANSTTSKTALAARTTTGRRVLYWNDDMDLPHHFLSLDAALSLPSKDDPIDIAKRFVRDNRSLFQFSDDQLETARVSARESIDRDGITRLVIEQQVNGVRVFDSEMLFVIDRDGRVWSESGSFVPEIERLAPDPVTALSPEQALRRAARFCGAELTAAVDVMIDNVEGRRRAIFLSESVDSRSEASLAYYPVTRHEIRLAYQVLLYGAPTYLDAYLLLIDAHSGELLRRDSLTYALDPPMGLVFTKESPEIASREMVAFQGEPAASPAGWVEDLRTGGNNTQVFFDPDLTGGKLIKATAAGHFEFPIDLTPGRSPLDSAKASAANLFYWVNVAHDRFYALGFNESSRNFQSNNTDKGGLGGDPVRAVTLRGANIDPSSTNQLVRNNAFFQTSIDGNQPILAMLMWNVTAPTGAVIEMDSSYDAGVIIHEYTHGVTTRMSGTDSSIGLRSTQGGGMGEGWSDFFAMSFLAGDVALDSSFPTGSYITQRKRGVRNFPYTTRLDLNPLTLGDIGSFSEVHATGTVWCSMLWDMRQAFIERYGFSAGREAAERLVVNGLRLLPLAPTFADARDAILLADRMTNNGVNQGLIWRSFARRGLGKSAVTALATPATGLRIAVTEAYDVPAEFSAGSLIINDRPSTPAVIGEPLPLVVTDRDLNAASVDVLATNLRTGASTSITLAQTSAGRFAGSLTCTAQPGSGATLAAEPGDTISIAYANALNEAGASARLEVQTVAGRRVEVYSTDFERGLDAWAIGSTFWHLTERRSASTTHSLYFAKQKGVNEAKSFTPIGSAGSAFSPALGLQNLLSARLEFDYVFVGLLVGDQSSPSGDLFSITAANFPFVGPSPLTAEDPRLQVIFDLRPESDKEFRHASIDLRTIGSRTAFSSFAFRASSADTVRKKLEGFYVDNVRVTAVTSK